MDRGSLGAHVVATSPDQIDHALDGVVDTVGGPILVQAFHLLRHNGTLVALLARATSP